MAAAHVDAPHFTSAMTSPACYPHPAPDIVLMETHISWIFLAGPYAYKIKKPVDLGFVDFSSLERRRHFCEEELRLNARLAPQLYVDLVEIRGSPEAPRVNGKGPLLDYALRMRRFAQEALGKNLLAQGRLTPAIVADLARRIAGFHHDLPAAPAESGHGAAERTLGRALQNFDQIEPLIQSVQDRDALHVLRDWAEREYIDTRHHMELRRAAGRVRECHGDLHLGNIVLIDGALVPFDCLEFNAELRWNDVMSEVAFLAMDLVDRDAPRLAWLFLNEYLEASGDYSGVAVLRFYFNYRAIVRAKVHLLRAHQPGLDPATAKRLWKAYRSYIALALAWTKRSTPALFLMHGYSGCGKSTVALELAQSLGAVRIRSDVERKRLAGIAALERHPTAVAHGLYGSTSTAATYERLAATAHAVLAAGYTAIIDATFLKRAQRDEMRAVAAWLQVPVAVIDVRAPQALLEQRIASRLASGADASDAALDVLRYQLATAEPIHDDEALDVIVVDGRTRIPEELVLRLRLTRAAKEARAAPRYRSV